MKAITRIISLIESYSRWGNFILNVSIGLLALWQGMYIIATRNLSKLEALRQYEIRKSPWHKIKSLDGFVLVVVIIGFFIGCLLEYFHVSKIPE